MTYLKQLLIIIICLVFIKSSIGQNIDSILQSLGHKAYDLNQYAPDSCLYYANTLDSTAQTHNSNFWKAKAQYYLGVCYRSNGQSQEAQKALRTYLAYAESKNDTAEVAQTKYEIALDYLSSDDPGSLIELLNESYESFKLLGDKNMQASILNTKSNILRRQRQYDQAFDAIKEALQIFEELQDSTGIAVSYNSLGIIKATQGDMDGAIQYFEKQTVINRSRNDLDGLAHSLGNLGFAHLRNNSITEGESKIKEALTVRRQLGNPANIAMNLLQVAEVHVLQNEFPEAKKYNAEAIEIAEEKNISTVKQQLYKQASYIHENMGQIKTALSYFKKYEQIKDSLLNEQIVENTQKIEAIYQTAEKEKEIQQLEFEDKINQSRIKTQRFVMIGAFTGLGILSFLLYQLFGQKKKIEAQNGVIAKALDEKETLLKEIHHRVKNNLQVVSSLLRIQSNQTDDEVAVDALKEGQSRVQSMSLIHQDLYQHDNLKGINMSDYLERLTTGLFNTYNITQDRISIKTDIDDLQLDVDTVVPLGLIINELVTNSLKHAFPDNHEGQIEVSLHENNSKLILTVKDNGVGIETDKLEDSFGQGLVQAFANKLEAETHIKNDNGTQIRVTIADYQKV